MALPIDRRQFLSSTLLSSVIPSITCAEQIAPKEETIAFFLVGDTHYFADKAEKTKIDERSKLVCGRLVDLLNKLPGQEIPKEAGGGKVLPVQGVIHAGDCIDSGDKSEPKMQETEWKAFAEDYGLTGKDGKLKVPVYEVHGNHDSPRGDGLAVKQIIERNKKRPGLKNISKNGVHYSWDWGRFHFLNLGIVVGQVDDVKRKRRYSPLESLDFLISDLKENVGKSGRPVVITHHVDMIRYAQSLPVEDKKAEGMEWDPADVKGFHDAIKDYHIAAILYGHTHARNVFQWNGTSKGAKEGIPTFNVDNGSHYNSKQQAFFYIELREKSILVREYQTADAWENGKWTPLSWTFPL